MATTTAQDLFEQYKSLPVEERERFRGLLADGWTPTDEQREVIEQRLKDVQSGAVETVSEEQMWDRVAELRAKRRAGG